MNARINININTSNKKARNDEIVDNFKNSIKNIDIKGKKYILILLFIIDILNYFFRKVYLN